MSHKIIHVISVIDYIEQNLCKTLNLEMVSNAMHYSKYHLHRMFTEITGISIHHYIQRRKLTEAAWLLVFSNQSILEISFIAGYESQQAFTSIFKEMYKKTPNQYREEKEFYPLQLKYVLNKHAMKDNSAAAWKEEIALSSYTDIPQWLQLSQLVIDGFPNLKEKDHIQSLIQHIEKKQGFILKDNHATAGAMIYEPKDRHIAFLGIHPQYDKETIAKAFLLKIIGDDPQIHNISITTFRQGDKADSGYRQLFKRLGFTENELLVEFGYPTQKMILQCNCQEEQQ